MKKEIPFFVYCINEGIGSTGPDMWTEAVSLRLLLKENPSWYAEQCQKMEKELEYTCINEPLVDESLVYHRSIMAKDLIHKTFPIDEFWQDLLY